MALIELTDRIYVNPDHVSTVYISTSALEKDTYLYDVYINMDNTNQLLLADKLSLSEAEAFLKRTVYRLTDKNCINQKY